MSSTLIRPSRPARGQRDRVRLVGPAAAAYVGAWLTGLAIPVDRLAAGAAPEQARAHYVEQGTAVVLQVTLVHLVAGLALAAFTVAAATAAASGRRTAVLVAGLGVATISVLQWLLAVVAVTGAAAQDAGWSASLLAAITTMDAVKLVLLAGLVLSLTRALRPAALIPLWLEALGGVLAALLLLGSASLLAPSTPLDAALVASLLLLLCWVGALGVVLGRRSSSTGHVRGGRS